MEVGRNDPCPCGSGKKYKKCCLLKEQNTVSENNLKSQNLKNIQKENKNNEQEFHFNALNNLRKFLLEDKTHI